MIINKIRLKEENPMEGYLVGPWPLPTCDLNLDYRAGENGYFLKESAGLGPPRLMAVVEGFDNNGVPILGPVSEKRIISLKIELIPGINQSFSSLRDDLYKYVGRSVVISFMNGALEIAQTKGFIEQFESELFTNKPEIEIVIECKDGELEQPFVNTVPFAVLDTTDPVFNYEDGTAPTGLDLHFEATEDHAGILIWDHARMWHAGTGTVENEFFVDFDFLIGDDVYISTHPKNKRITVVRTGGVPGTYDLSGYLNAGAVWPKLYSGVNTWRWDLNSSWANWISASYYPRYWGV